MRSVSIPEVTRAAILKIALALLFLILTLISCILALLLFLKADVLCIKICGHESNVSAVYHYTVAWYISLFWKTCCSASYDEVYISCQLFWSLTTQLQYWKSLKFCKFFKFMCLKSECYRDACMTYLYLFYCWSFFLYFFLSPKDLRDGSTDREPF